MAKIMQFTMSQLKDIVEDFNSLNDLEEEPDVHLFLG